MMNNATHNVKVGDLFNMSWGYDQTQSEYFQVTRTTAKGVYVRQIACQAVPGTQGFMCEHVVPVRDNFLSKSQWCGGFNSNNPETFRRIQFSSYRPEDKTPYFNFEGRYFARPVQADESSYTSWYA